MTKCSYGQLWKITCNFSVTDDVYSTHFISHLQHYTYIATYVRTYVCVVAAQLHDHWTPSYILMVDYLSTYTAFHCTLNNVWDSYLQMSIDNCTLILP